MTAKETSKLKIDDLIYIRYDREVIEGKVLNILKNGSISIMMLNNINVVAKKNIYQYSLTKEKASIDYFKNKIAAYTTTEKQLEDKLYNTTESKTQMISSIEYKDLLDKYPEEFI